MVISDFVLGNIVFFQHIIEALTIGLSNVTSIHFDPRCLNPNFNTNLVVERCEIHST
ncbi:MAG: hypothetical protein US69_C0002G0033 [candidate division TM6 bacterium GW2011_GWF2_38_10]|nr:MAG: hypothetical protein US69_C0002G0033 [candidate division TM6 bacterium GW2011_GWF2_38_10]